MVGKVFFSAKTQYENLGDGVIGCQLLRRVRHLGELLVDNRCSPKWYDSILGVAESESARAKAQGFKRQILLAGLRSLFSSSSVYLVLKPGHIFGGGGLLHEIAYTGFMLLLCLLRVRIVRYGCSLGPFSQVAAWFEPIKAFCFYDYTARDQLSIEYCRTIGIDDVRYCPDMAFGLDCSSGLKDKKYSFALSFRTGTTSENDSAYIAKLEHHLLSSTWMESNKKSALFVSQVKRDEAYQSDLQLRLSKDASVKFYRESKDSEKEIFSSYEGVDIVYSNRLHVLLFAASRGAIPVPLVESDKHMKIVGIFKDVGLESLIFDISGGASLDDHIGGILGDKNTIRASIQKVFEQQNIILNTLNH